MSPITGGKAQQGSFCCTSWKYRFCLLLLCLIHITTAVASRTLSEETHSSVAEDSHNDSDNNNSTEAAGEGHSNQELDCDEIGHEGQADHETEPAHAVLFPSFTLTLGLLVFIVLTRFWAALPFTAVMFLVGTLMGLAVELLPDADDHVAITTRMWTNIDSEVLLLVFLPGLIFKDAMGLNVHLFRVGVGQCLIFAFPMVLLGTFLTGCIARYVFPYDWSWNLALTFGSILSATDPVAVAALLEEVGAPPRLKVHIAGEALLNDGAAIVFFTIFATRYFFELDKEDFGEDVGWGRGFELFFRMSLGGVAIGMAFGLGIILILYFLDRRFSREENIVEVTATAALAYLGYYVAEIVCHTSGVIATVAAGVTVKFLGRAMLNDAKLLDDFWVLLEHLLNTILFTLGGAVWGAIIANGESHGDFTAKDWGYLIVLYILLTVVRFVLFFLAFPVTSRIGLKTNWKETLFQVYGGLRGAVGIALAIALDHSVMTNVGEDSIFAEQTTKAFGMIGGMAFLTLVINGTSAGPLLIKLGLADSTETRKKIVNAFRAGFKQHLILEFVSLLTQNRFRNVNFGLVKSHVPYLADMTKVQLVEAIERHKDTTASDEYQPPYLQGVLPYLEDEPEESPFGLKNGMPKSKSTENLLATLVAEAQKAERAKRAEKRHRRRRRKSNIHHLMAGEPLSAHEMRTLFISILKGTYEKMIDHGELVDREFLAITLEQSLEFAADAVANGGPLQDWKFVNIVDSTASTVLNRVKKDSLALRLAKVLMGKNVKNDIKYSIKRLKIERAMCFMAAHKAAQRFVQQEFENVESELSEAALVVLNESRHQWNEAEAVLKSYKKTDVELVTSHKFCAILLNSGAHYISKLVQRGLLKEDEAEHWVKDIEEQLDHVLRCTVEGHPGELQIAPVDEQDGGVESMRKNGDEPNQDSFIEAHEVLEEQLQEVQKMFEDVDDVSNIS